MIDRARHVVICGGGASAVILVRALAKSAVAPLDVTLVEERTPVGPGLAYSTTSASHLLNVPAGRMSADASDGANFIDWLNDQDGARHFDANDFVSRSLYGVYLKDLLSLALTDSKSPVQVRVRHARVAGLARAHQRHWKVLLDDNRDIDAEAVVIATGNERPRAFQAINAGVDPALVLQDPWDADAKAAIGDDKAVTLIGSGLTAVDVCVELLDRGHQGPIKMVSPQGLLPRKHAPALVSGSWLIPPYPKSIAELVRATRDEAHRTPGEEAWRTTIDALRPNLPAIWAELSEEGKTRFLRHVRPFWEVHRHRMAPQVAAQLERAIEEKRLMIHRGRVAAIEPAQITPLNIKLKPRGRHASSLGADIVINCTGPDYNPRATRNPLIAALLSRGFARPDPLHLGLDTNDDCVLGADGKPQENLYAIGPVARGRLWEVTAIPEIRQQAAVLSRRITLPEVGHELAYTI